jgi:kynurenine formamidase
MAEATVVSSERSWGRWGEDDERGSLNLLTPDLVLAATRACRTGVVYNLGLPVGRQGAPFLPYRGQAQRLTMRSASDGEGITVYEVPAGYGANEDVLVAPTHHGTHMDALCHVFADDQMYNGYSSREFTSYHGAPHCGIEKTGGFAGRAVLLDLPGHFEVEWLEPGMKVSSDDLEACRASQGIEMHCGDVLLVRTGWLDCWAELTRRGEAIPSAQPGLGRASIDFVVDHDVAAIGADNAAVEVLPFDGPYIALHVALLVGRGITFLEHLALARLAADGCYESLFIAAPLLIAGASGSPLNPIAIG